MLVYRLCKAKFADLSGAGAKLYGGRWNSPGISVVYTASNTSLAILETRVHLRAMPVDYVRLTIEIDDYAPIVDIGLAFIPGRPFDNAATRAVGDNHFQKTTGAALKVPSAIVPTEWNLLFSPEFAVKHVHVIDQQPIALDERLWKA